MTRRAALRLVPALLALALVAACGKKGAPKPPNPETDRFPRQYPKPQ